MPHNGGTVGVNLWFTTLSADYPFMNVLKAGSGTNPIDNTTAFDASKHDSDGYMHTVYGSGRYAVYPIEKLSERPGNRVIKWDGAGTIYSPWTTTVSGSLTTAGATGRAVVSLGVFAQDGSISIGVSAVGTPGSVYPTNIRLCHVDDEAALDADPYAFNTKFLQVMTDAKIGTIRFMDPMGTNDSTWREWAHRTSLTAMSYGGSTYPTSLYAGDTANSGDDYTVALSGFTLVDGAQAIVRFNATSSGLTPRINVEGTGLVKIYNAYGGPLSSATKPTVGKTGTLTYSSLMGRWLLAGGNSENKGISGGWPIEIILKLCEEIGCHPWLNIPHMAFEPTTTLATEMATYFRDNKPAWMKEKFEPSNEVWNSGFGQTQHAYLKQGARDSTVFKGDWVTATAYSVGDGVFNTIADGRYFSYICLQAHTSSSTYNPGNSPAWATSTAYVIGDAVRASSSDYLCYVCLANHTSGSSFTTDLNAGKWTIAWQFQFNTHDWMGRSASILGKLVSAVYSADRTKYDCFSAYQLYGGTTGTTLKRLTSTAYVAETGNASDAAYNWVTHICAALYVRPTDHGTATEATYVAEYPTATAARKTELIDLYASGETTGGNGQAWADAIPYIDAFSALATTYSIKPSLYEGGYEALVTGSADQQTFRKASKFSATLHRLTQKRIRYLVSKNFEFPCWYVFSTADTWGLIAPTIYNTETASWTGISDYNNGVTRYKLTAS